MKGWTVVGYTYQAEVLCPECALSALGIMHAVLPAETELDRLAAIQGIDRQDEWSFDSDDFPKVIFSSSVEDEEACMKCGEELIA